MKTILVLEDEPSIMKLMRLMLHRYRLIEADTAEEALLLFIDYDQRIDLLVADVTLPKGSGIQVALRLRTKLPGLPVVLTSGLPVNHWSHKQSADLARLGWPSAAIVQKPFEDDNLSDAVNQLIGAASYEPMIAASTL